MLNYCLIIYLLLNNFIQKTYTQYISTSNNYYFQEEYIKNIIYKRAIFNIKRKKYLYASDVLFTYYNKFTKDPRAEIALFKSCLLSYVTLYRKNNDYIKLETLYRINIYITKYSNNNYNKCILLKKIKNILISQILKKKLLLAHNYFLINKRL